MNREELQELTGQNYEQLVSNEAYRKWSGTADARLRNGIRAAVNEKDQAYREKIEPGAQVYFDYLMREAELYEQYGGVRPVFEMEELEW